MRSRGLKIKGFFLKTLQSGNLSGEGPGGRFIRILGVDLSVKNDVVKLIGSEIGHFVTSIRKYYYLPSSIMSLTAVYSVCISKISRNKLIMIVKH